MCVTTKYKDIKYNLPKNLSGFQKPGNPLKNKTPNVKWIRTLKFKCHWSEFKINVKSKWKTVVTNFKRDIGALTMIIRNSIVI